MDGRTKANIYPYKITAPITLSNAHMGAEAVAANRCSANLSSASQRHSQPVELYNNEWLVTSAVHRYRARLCIESTSCVNRRSVDALLPAQGSYGLNATPNETITEVSREKKL